MDTSGIELRAVFAALVRATLPHVTDVFTIGFVPEDLDYPYVQGCLEDDDSLELEISAPAFTRLEPAASATERLLLAGWTVPTGTDLPNFWRVVDVRATTWDEITDLIVDGLEVLFDVFSNVPDTIGVEVMPAELAALVWPDGLPIDDVRWPGEQVPSPINVPDTVPESGASAWDVSRESNSQLESFVAAHDGRGYLYPVDALGLAGRWFHEMTVSIEPTERGPMTVVTFDLPDEEDDEFEREVPTCLELVSRPEPHPTLNGWLLNSTEGLLYLTEPHFEAYHWGPSCDEPRCRRTAGALGNQIEAASWAVAAHIAQTDPRIRIFHTHPAGGQSDCLHLVGQGFSLDINRAGSIHTQSDFVPGNPPPIPPVDWLLRLLLGGSPKELAREVCERARIPWPSPRPASRPHTLTYRIIAHVLQQHARDTFSWRARTQFEDTSGYQPESMVPPVSEELRSVAGNLVWIVGAERADATWFWDGWAWPPTGERLDLYALYRSGSTLDEVTAKAFEQSRHPRGPRLPALTRPPEQPEFWWPSD